MMIFVFIFNTVITDFHPTYRNTTESPQPAPPEYEPCGFIFVKAKKNPDEMNRQDFLILKLNCFEGM